VQERRANTPEHIGIGNNTLDRAPIPQKLRKVLKNETI
jgi:hypothetical protein